MVQRTEKVQYASYVDLYLYSASEQNQKLAVHSYSVPSFQEEASTNIDSYWRMTQSILSWGNLTDNILIQD